MSYLVDSNVLSEQTKPQPDQRALAWLNENDANIVLNPIILGEIEFGIRTLPAGRRRTGLLKWFTAGVQLLPVLPIDAVTAVSWAGLLAELHRKGRTMPVKDSLIAATARQHGLSVATRNIADYKYAGVGVINPFDVR
jgi:predicted nucleic acid-binding protein